MGESGATTVAVWSVEEQSVAQQAFASAQQRAIEGLIHAVRLQAGGLDSVESLWQLHDFLSIQRHAMEGRFDFRLDGILFVFAGLVKDGLLAIDELAGLEADKLAKIRAMAQF